MAKGTKSSNQPGPKKMAVPGFEPGSSGSQPLMLTTTLYHHSVQELQFPGQLVDEPP